MNPLCPFVKTLRALCGKNFLTTKAHKGFHEGTQRKQNKFN